jgi:hypothetical protein
MSIPIANAILAAAVAFIAGTEHDARCPRRFLEVLTRRRPTAGWPFDGLAIEPSAR